ncbi:MAG: putative zinc-binding metallopeptidase [Opitutales bacterium]
MQRFPCPSCGNTLFFENTVCEACGEQLAFDPEVLALVTAPTGEDTDLLCANAAHAACHWTLAGSPHPTRCLACAPNRTLPDLSAPESLPLWQRTEQAKHRLVYSLLRFRREALRAPLADGSLQFDFLLPQGNETLLTGHADGLITLNLLEARDSYRESTRTRMGEPYRTLVGHLRHEIGHFYWTRLIEPEPDALERFRALFSDERAPRYADALAAHYADGPGEDWAQHCISAYAAAHPWEDWAETWAYYLHLVDALDTAAAHGLAFTSHEAGGDPVGMPADPYTLTALETLLTAWGPLSVAINSLNRSLGTNDPTPFVLNRPVVEKLQFIHERIHLKVCARAS